MAEMVAEVTGEYLTAIYTDSFDTMCDLFMLLLVYIDVNILRVFLFQSSVEN